MAVAMTPLVEWYIVRVAVLLALVKHGLYKIFFKKIFSLDFGVANIFKRDCRDLQFPLECGKSVSEIKRRNAENTVENEPKGFFCL